MYPFGEDTDRAGGCTAMWAGVRLHSCVGRCAAAQLCGQVCGCRAMWAGVRMGNCCTCCSKNKTCYAQDFSLVIILQLKWTWLFPNNVNTMPSEIAVDLNTGSQN